MTFVVALRNDSFSSYWTIVQGTPHEQEASHQIFCATHVHYLTTNLTCERTVSSTTLLTNATCSMMS